MSSLGQIDSGRGRKDVLRSDESSDGSSTPVPFNPLLISTHYSSPANRRSYDMSKEESYKLWALL